jgi:hypothetical protein
MRSANTASVLFITLDSCRYDTFARASAPAMKRVAPLHKAQAPSYFTFGSHAAMFAGFTPGIADVAAPLLNPKFGKLFKLGGAAFAGQTTPVFALDGRNVVDGFRRLGYATIGSGAVAWFDPRTAAPQLLTGEFDHFFYPGNAWSLRRQLAWIGERLRHVRDAPVFVFLNVGETHAPYYHQGAPWQPADNPCIPFQRRDRRADCALRQRACVEYVDAAVAPLLDHFADATTVICGDHGDCWGEDGLWEHGMSHPMTLTVPLLMRVHGRAVAAPAAR